MFKSIGAALGQPTPNHNRQPIRRHSHLAGRCEGVFWRRTSRQEARRIVLAARRYELAGRAAGRRNGPLGHVALELLDLLANLMDRRTGRLEPSLTWLMEKLRRSRDAVTRAMAVLRAHGFLDWLRRYEATGREGRGPQVRQVSNAYRLLMPQRAARLLGIQGQPAPVPDDVEYDHEVRQQECKAYKTSLHLEDLAMLEVADDRLRQLLAQLGRCLQERESAKRTESETKFSM